MPVLAQLVERLTVVVYWLNSKKSHKSSGRWFDSDRQDKRQNNNNEQTLLLFYEDTI